MDKPIRSSSVYISISSNTAKFEQETLDYIDMRFNDLFNSSAKKIIDVEVDNNVEIVYEVMSPMIESESLTKEFFKRLEILFKELKEYKPHFTQYKRGDN